MPGLRKWPILIDDERSFDQRPGPQALLRAIHAALPNLTKLLHEYNSQWSYEDPVYRFYYGSFKVYWLQEATKKIVKTLQALMPKTKLNKMFVQIIERGTGKTWIPEHNQRWDQETAPIVEAFFHARYFLDMAVRFGQELKFAPSLLPSGWAALLCLFEMR